MVYGIAYTATQPKLKGTDMNINDILLAQNIHRWTIVSTIQQQSLAEHTFNVMAIARDICVEADMDDTNVMKYAFDHDLDEIETGDIPSPAKVRYHMTHVYNGKNKEACSPEELAIVKAADLLDALVFIKANAHDRHGYEVYQNMEGVWGNFIDKLQEDFPRIGDAVNNTYSMIWYGKFEVERR